MPTHPDHTQTYRDIFPALPGESNRDYARRWAAWEKEQRAAVYVAETEQVEARNGELPKRDLTELRQLREQIEAARTERQTRKESLILTRDTEQAKKEQLQLDLDAAVGKAAKDPIRLALDECNAKLAQAREDLDAADATLDQLRAARDELLLQERITTDAITVEDQPEITRRKQEQAAEVEERRTWLAKRAAHQKRNLVHQTLVI